jgi:hypothetical protein
LSSSVAVKFVLVPVTVGSTIGSPLTVSASPSTGDRHRDIRLDRAADEDRHLQWRHREITQLGRHGVGARRERDEAVLSSRVRHGVRRAVHPLRRHRHARSGRPCWSFTVPFTLPPGHLSEGRADIARPRTTTRTLSRFIAYSNMPSVLNCSK